jgi:hypothetical protein
MDMRLDDAVMLYDGSGIYDHVFANLRICVNDGASEHCGAYSHMCLTADNRGGMHNARQGGVAGPFPDDNRAPRSVVPDGRDDRVNVKFLPTRNRSEHGPPQECLPRQCGIIVEKTDNRGSMDCHGGVGNDLAMSSRTHNRDSHESPFPSIALTIGIAAIWPTSAMEKTTGSEHHLVATVPWFRRRFTDCPLSYKSSFSLGNRRRP